MLVRLTRTHRLKAGWIVALAYLLCVLAPTISYALPGEHSAAPCVTAADHVPGMLHVHNELPTKHVHKDGQIHEHPAAHSHAGSDSNHHLVSMAMDKPAPAKAPHSPSGECCGLMCVSALPATLTDFVTPSAPMAVCEAEGYLKATDNAPSRLYRPPIS